MEDNRPDWGRGCSKGCLLPIRVVITLLGFCALVCAYTNRVSISHVITMLVVPHNRTDEHTSEQVCPKEETEEESSGNDNLGEYVWSEQLQGIVLGSFYVGYLITHLPGGVLADKYGAKWVLGLCVFISGLTTFLSPVAIKMGEAVGLIIIRIVMGAAQGPLFPALTTLLSAWVPKRERATLGTLCYSGVTAGTVFSNLGSGFMLHHFHWPITLIAFGGVTCLWFVFFILLSASKPPSHACIKPEELAYLKENIPQSDVSKTSVPWKDLMLSKVMLAVIISQIGHDWGYYVMITCLPKYVANVLQFSIRSNGLVTSLPFVAMFICTNLSGCLADWLIRTEKMKIGSQRKLFTFLAALGPGGLTVVASYAGCDRVLVVFFFTFAMFTMGFYYAGQKLSPLDMSPAYSGTIMAITNGLGSFAGIFSPIVVGWMTPNATMGEWRMVFWLGFIILVVSAIVFAIWGSADVQPYDPSYTGEKKA